MYAPLPECALEHFDMRLTRGLVQVVRECLPNVAAKGYEEGAYVFTRAEVEILLERLLKGWELYEADGEWPIPHCEVVINFQLTVGYLMGWLGAVEDSDTKLVFV
jgi:hypothetical protein